MEVGQMISGGALLLSVIAMVLSGRKDTRSDAAANAIVQTKLDNLITGVNDIRVEIRSMRESITDHSERIARIESLAESNRHRIDILEKGE